jgi:DASS family divalent anion:Na+ symporter
MFTALVSQPTIAHAAAAAAVLVSMAGGLQSLGVIDLFSGWAGSQLSGLDLPWPALFAGLHLLFFAMHYLFASQTAHVGALFAAFCSLMISAGEACVLSAAVYVDQQ